MQNYCPNNTVSIAYVRAEVIQNIEQHKIQELDGTDLGENCTCIPVSFMYYIK